MSIALAGQAVEGGRATGVIAAPADARASCVSAASAGQRLADQHLARRKAHQLAGKIRAGTSPTSNSPVEMSSEAEREGLVLAVVASPRRLEQGGQIVARPGIEQAVLGQRARRHEPHDVAAHDRLGAALARLCRVLELLAHRHPVAEPDQPLQIFVGAVDGHPAHGDVLPKCLPRLVSTMPSACEAATASSKNSS